MWLGVSFALAAGLLWGLVFVTPLMLADYPGVLLSFGRYLAFGLIALPLAWLDRGRLALLTRADWVEALKLALVGNLIYYVCLAAAIQKADVLVPTLLIGTLPVVIALSARWLETRAGAGSVPIAWRALLPSLLLIGAGLLLVNGQELARLHSGLAGGRQPSDFWLGVLLAVGAVMCWTWYPIRNSRWLRAHPDRSPTTWATAQGLATLPLALIGYAGWLVWAASSGMAFDLPLGPRPTAFVGLMLTLGLLASWLGTLLWNQASQRLPTSLAGQLIVFETLAALAYGFVWNQRWPDWMVGAGIALLIAGVVWGVHAFQRQSVELGQGVAH
jgi:drug/metabolite transporter (DMT)-like permease